MNGFTIRDLENLSGIKAHTIRVWEQRYRFLKPQRTPTNIRYYTNDELKIILNVSLLNKYGFKISHIDRMAYEEMEQRILTLDDAQAIQERLVNELIRHMVDMNITAFEKTLTGFITQKSIERAIPQLIFPFLEKTGMLWQSGHINPAQEHLASNSIRQKLIVAIEKAVPVKQSRHQCVLYLPEGEYHELGLLYIYYLLKSRGVPAIYLGANVPVKDVGFVVKMKKPDYALIHLTAGGNNFNFEKLLINIRQHTGNIRTIISGQIVQSYRKAPPSCIEFKKSFSEITELVGSL
jgi:DNA-binding transcriptional MerR regulator